MADDKQEIKDYNEKIRKEIIEQNDHMKYAHGYNSSSIVFDLKETPNGWAMVVRGKFDPTKFDQDWKYEPSYNLDANYAKEGIYRMVDGNYEFIPIVHEQLGSEVAVYRDVNDIAAAIKASNPHIPADCIKIDTTSGRGEIQLVNVLNAISVPNGLKMENGELVDVNDYGKSVGVSYVNAESTTSKDVTAGKSIPGEVGTYTEELGQAALQEEVHDYKEEEPADGIGSEDIMRYLNFENMQNVLIKYQRSGNYIVTKEEDGTYLTMEARRVNDPEVVRQFEVAECLVVGINEAKSKNNNERIEVTSTDYNRSMSAMMQCRNNANEGYRISQITEALFVVNDGISNLDVIRTMIYFLSNPLIAKNLNIQMDMSAEEAINKVQSMSNDYLREKWGDLMSPFMEDPEDVMEPPPPMPPMGNRPPQGF